MQHKPYLFLTKQNIEDAESKAFAAGMPAEALMEKAGLRLAERVMFFYPYSKFKKVAVLAGPGHNGGDAFVVARELFLHGYDVRVVEIDAAKQRPFTATHAAFFKALGGCVTSYSLLPSKFLNEADFFVDGLMGFGLTREFNHPLVALLNSSGKPIVSLDVPSGLHVDNGIIGPCIKATQTLCLQFFKNSFCFDSVVDWLGQVECLDLGIDSFATDRSVAENKILLQLPSRKQSAHKYSSGKVSLLAGSPDYKGAGVLTTLACRQTGVGFITLVSEAAECLETLKIAPDVVCTQSPDFKKDDCVLIGPGLLPTTDVEKWLNQIDKTVVLDAGALQKKLVPTLKKRTEPSILTPHAGEFSRMFPHLILTNKIEMARQAAHESNAIVVLKGPRTVIASPNGHVRVQMQSTPALARAGTGDVLAGLIAGLVPQFADAFEATCFAVYWHSLAACDLEMKQGTQAVNATSLIAHLPLVLMKDSE